MTAEPYDGLILDHDGVVVPLSPMSTLRSAAADAFADAGVLAPRPADIDAITIRVTPAELRAVAGRYDLDPGRLWSHREDRIEAALRSEIEAGRKAPYDGVKRLEDLDAPLGIASNNQTRIVEFVLRTYGLADRFGTVRARAPTLDSLEEKKPEPVYPEAAAADLGCSTPLYVGDSESDVVAGQRAGFDTVFLRRGHNADRELTVEPTAEVSTLTEVVELFDAGRGAD